jgi:hypothetical protein
MWCRVEDNHEQRVDVFDGSVEAFSFPSMGTLFTYVEDDTYHKEAPHDDGHTPPLPLFPLLQLVD